MISGKWRGVLIASLAAAGVALTFHIMGPPVLILAGVAAFLFLVWRFDNWTGSCFMLAILTVLVVTVLLLLLALVALRPTQVGS